MRVDSSAWRWGAAGLSTVDWSVCGFSDGASAADPTEDRGVAASGAGSAAVGAVLGRPRAGPPLGFESVAEPAEATEGWSVLGSSDRCPSADPGPSVGGPSVGGPSVGGPSVGGPSVAGPSVAGPSVAGPSVGRPLGGRPLGGRPVGGRPLGGRPLGHQAAGGARRHGCRRGGLRRGRRGGGAGGGGIPSAVTVDGSSRVGGRSCWCAAAPSSEDGEWEDGSDPASGVRGEVVDMCSDEVSCSDREVDGISGFVSTSPLRGSFTRTPRPCSRPRPAPQGRPPRSTAPTAPPAARPGRIRPRPRGRAPTGRGNGPPSRRCARSPG